MHRRTLLKSGAAALLALGVEGCATNKTSVQPGRLRTKLNAAPVEASWDP
jgi:hypothetical protein